MGFLNDRPVAKITSAAILIASTVAFITGSVPEASNEVVTLLIGASSSFLFASSIATKV